MLIRDMGNNVVPLRRPSGTPVGGQFAPTTRDEAEVVLESPVPSAFDLPDGSDWSHWTHDGEADAIVTDREGVGSGIVRALDAEQWHTSDGRTAYSWSASADGRQIGSGIVTDPEEAMMFVSSALDRAERGIKDEWESGYGPTAASWASREDLTLFVNHFRHDDVGWAVSRDGIEIACGDSTDSVSAQLAATQAANQVRDGWYPPSDGYSALEPMTLGEFQRNGDGQYTTVVGPKYTNEWRKPSEIAAAVRNDIKEAVAAGQLPSEVNGHPVTYSVRSRSKGTSAVDVTVHGIRDVDQTEPQPEGNYSRQYKKPLKETTRRLLALTSAYDRSTSDVMTDYHNGRYWSDVTVESESSAAFWAKDKATSKIKAEYQKAIRSGADAATLAEIAGRYKAANTEPSEDYNPFRSGS